MKVNILVGTRFQAAQLAKILLDYKYNINIYSSSPASKWQLSREERYRIHFIPLFANIFTAITKIPLPNCIREFSVTVFDFLSSIFMVRSDILHVWSSFGLYSIKKAKKHGSIIFVEKSCPHPNFQNKLLDEEAIFLNIERKTYSDSFTQRAIEEFKLADKIVVCSTYTLNSFLENGIKREQLYNVALDANFTTKRIHDKNYDKNQLIVGMVGGSIIRKGFIYLLQAWKELNISNAKLLLKTSESALMKVPKIWDMIKGDNTIEVLGYFDDMEDFYEQCDLFVLPSIDEGFGMVVFEALSCSLPVIITKNVGAGDFITDTQEGFIIDIRNAQQIKEKIEYLNNNRDVMKTMSLNAKKLFDAYQERDDNYKNRVKQLYSDVENIK
jgi:glycosyltransferase involved in cell wall biosynthesis